VNRRSSVKALNPRHKTKEQTEMSRKRTKQYLMLLLVIGLVSIAAGGSGTFASFTAETTNAGNTFATGTLLLSNKVATGSTCYSNAAATNDNLNAACQTLISTSNMKTGTSTVQYLTVKNEGTIDGTDVKVYIPKTQTGLVSCLNSTTGTFPGSDALSHTGDVCGNLKISIEQDSSANGTATACLVGVEVGSGNHACNPVNGTTFSTFYGANYDSAHMLDLGAPTALAAGASDFFKVYMYLPDENNTFQGRTAAFDIDWHLDQA
jgi:predicted ribosomally synthesized peptide with SipW-like signal peptide